MPASLVLSPGRYGDTPAIRVTGTLVYGEPLQALHELVSRAAAQGHKRLILDVGGVTTTDTSGISALLAMTRALGGQGTPIVLSRPSQRLRAVLAMMRVSSVFELVDDEADVVRRFGEWQAG